MVGWSFPVSMEMQESWYEKSLCDGQNKRFIVEDAAGNAAGVITLLHIDWKNRSADTGIKLLKASRGKGIGTDALTALTGYAFDELQLHRLNCSWLEGNTASERLHLKCGWRIEGKKKDAVYKNGGYVALVYAGILEVDYRKTVKKPQVGERK